MEKNIHAINYGISVDEIKEAAKADQVESSIDWDEIDRLQKGNCIQPMTLFKNLDRIKIGEIPEGSVMHLLEKSLSFCSSQNEMCFPKIREFIAPSSIEYLRVANCFQTHPISIQRTRAALVAICLAKVIEDELNQGLFNLFRGAFSVLLPEYFDIFQEDKGDIIVPFRYSSPGNNNTSKPNVPINIRDTEETMQLRYPTVSNLRNIAFNRACTLRNPDPGRFGFDPVIRYNKARDMIKSSWDRLPEEDWDELSEKLEVIAETRNHAIHYPEPISELEVAESIGAFEYLAQNHFFEKNHYFKQINSNEFLFS